MLMGEGEVEGIIVSWRWQMEKIIDRGKGRSIREGGRRGKLVKREGRRVDGQGERVNGYENREGEMKKGIGKGDRLKV